MTTGSSVKRNVIASWGVHASNMVIGFFLTRYTLDVLGVSTYGNWLFINSIAAYANLLYCGFGETISRYVSKYHADNDQQRMNEVVSLVTYIFRGLGCIAFAAASVLAATAQWWGGWEGDMLLQVRITCLILGLNVAISMSGTSFGGVLHGLRRFDLERGVGFAFDIVRLILFLVFLREEWGIVLIAAIFFVVTVGENLCYVLFAYHLLPNLEVRWKHVRRETLNECWSFSTMSFVNTIASQVINATDTIVIGIMLDKEAIVPYYFGLRLAQFCRQPIDKIAHICLPTAGSLHSEADRPKRLRFFLRALGVVVLLITGLFIGAWYFGRDVLNIWVGPKLSPQDHLLAHRVLMILLGAHLIALPCNICRAFLFGLGIVRIPACIYVLEAILNFGISIVLCHSYGVEGVAWGTAIPVTVIELGVLLPYAVRHLGISWTRLFKEGLWPAALPLLALWAYAIIVSRQSWSHDDWRALILIAIAGGAVLGGAKWLTERPFWLKFGSTLENPRL
ncbi:lipopolysaccharide biosynthesis protein [Schlesneria paludicola]|uniref:lipopolysaccharide biosynthesis protein n=1 Tax=Schlesneria paludicola TaxID=360056 RepID=UPI00031DB0A0|nr:polysaccharide biosynthesis C-terminal domain-containing protein [Schlesneria paludicola]